MEIFNLTLTQMLVMFCFMLAGFILNKTRRLPENSAIVLSKLENYFLVPCMLIDSFMSHGNIKVLGENYHIVIYSLILLFFALVISIPLSRLFGKGYVRNIYKYALTFGNFGFMGNAVVLGVLGDVGLFRYLLFTLPLQIAVNSWGIVSLVPNGERKENPLKKLINPVFISLTVGMVLGIINAKSFMPEFVLSTVSSAKLCMGPIAMFLTGFIVGNYNFKGLLLKKRVYIATALRLIVIPTILISIAKLLGASTEILTFALFAVATPLGLNTIIFPAAYGGDTSLGASMAMISHVLSVATLPLMYLLLIV